MHNLVSVAACNA